MNFKSVLVGAALVMGLSGCDKEYRPLNPLIQERIVTHENREGGIAIYQFHTRRDPTIKGATFIKQYKVDPYGQRTLAGHYQDLNKNVKVDRGDFCFVTEGETPHVPLEDRFVCSTHLLNTIHTRHPVAYDEKESDSYYLDENKKLKTYARDGIWFLQNSPHTPQQSIKKAQECITLCPTYLLETKG